jgi:hypothetical protein
MCDFRSTGPRTIKKLQTFKPLFHRVLGAIHLKPMRHSLEPRKQTMRHLLAHSSTRCACTVHARVSRSERYQIHIRTLFLLATEGQMEAGVSSTDSLGPVCCDVLRVPSEMQLSLPFSRFEIRDFQDSTMDNDCSRCRVCRVGVIGKMIASEDLRESSCHSWQNDP